MEVNRQFKRAKEKEIEHALKLVETEIKKANSKKTFKSWEKNRIDILNNFKEKLLSGNVTDYELKSILTRL